MRTLENYYIAKKPAMVMVSLICLGLSTNFLPESLMIITRLGTIVTFFAAGMLAAQHAAIWEKGERIRRGPDNES